MLGSAPKNVERLVCANPLALHQNTFGLSNEFSRAQRNMEILGSALFIFFSNVMALLPGLNPPTANLNVTFGCAIFVFLAFNYYGLKENGWG